MVKIIWSEKFISKFEEICNYLNQEFPPYRIKFANMVVEDIEILKITPKIGRVVPEREDRNLREILEGSYRMVYRVFDNHIDLLTIFHGMQQFPTDIE